jgi:hypothetical protein
MLLAQGEKKWAKLNTVISTSTAGENIKLRNKNKFAAVKLQICANQKTGFTSVVWTKSMI